MKQVIDIRELNLSVELELPDGAELVYIRDWDPDKRELKPYDYVFTRESDRYLLHYRGKEDEPPTTNEPSIGFYWCNSGKAVSKRVRVG